jgi:hypothetical protein
MSIVGARAIGPRLLCSSFKWQWACRGILSQDGWPSVWVALGCDERQTSPQRSDCIASNGRMTGEGFGRKRACPDRDPIACYHCLLFIFYINKNVNVRLCKIVNRVQKRKSPKGVHRWLCNLDTTLQSNTRVFLYTYYIYIYIYRLYI